MMKFAALTAAVLFVAVSAAPAADNAEYITTTTLTDSACVFYASGTQTETSTIPGSTFTYDDPSTTTLTTTWYVLPTTTAAAKRAQTTIVVSEVCAETRTVNPITTTADPAVVTTTTAYASTETYTSTYTLCIPGHHCF
ncbi:hypothetical protein BD626DRAFT_540643 [Schizophyllum amplum]|uniref:Uncharacterized protein n=1 Tax=Schizophyllum amplum TaxID=97359 RepID=A0A550BXT4_9AGAR|nr:hypothetical protein BD626DRAFT_540643 [Auriculariopsis ampla]